MTGSRLHLAAIAGLAALLCWTSPASAQTAPSLGSAQSFAVLGGSTVTDSGSSVITGDLGVSPGSAVTGFPPGVVIGGTIHAADAVAHAAQDSVTTAYNSLVGEACTQDLTGQDLGGKTLTPGVYCFASSAQLTGTLTLDAQGNVNAVFIFKIGSTLTTAGNASVLVINGGQVCNVFWQVGSSATLGTGTLFSGNILAFTSITLTSGARVAGRVLARNGAVTLATNDVSVSNCSAVVSPTCPAITITLSPATLPNATRGVAYSQTISASGGTAPYTFTLTGGSLPAGLTLSSAGILAGTPTTTGISTFTVRATDADGCFRDILYTLTIVSAPGCPPIALSPAALTNSTLGVAYSQTIVGSGGTAPYTFTVASGTLPAGLTLSSPGVLSGTPTTVGSSTFTVRGEDAAACFAEITYAVTVSSTTCPPITLTPATLPSSTLGIAYSATITGSGGTAPYTFAIVSGVPPQKVGSDTAPLMLTGLTLSPAGVLSGTPTIPGPYTFGVRGTDASGCFAELPYTVTTISAVPTLPQIATLLLAVGLIGLGCLRLQRRTRAE